MVESQGQVADRMEGWGWEDEPGPDAQGPGRSLNVYSEDGGQFLKDLIKE